MTDPIHEQLSAFLDGELSAVESELLLKRIERDPTLKVTLERYVLAGEALRARQLQTRPSRDFTARVAAAIDKPNAEVRTRVTQWLKPIAGGAIAAGVAAVALVSLQTPMVASQQGTTNQPGLNQQGFSSQPSLVAEVQMPGQNGAVSTSLFDNREGESYVVPMPSGRAAPPIQVFPNGQLANYVVAHSEYSSPLSRRNVLTGLIAEDSTAVADPNTEEKKNSPADQPDRQLAISPR